MFFVILFLVFLFLGIIGTILYYKDTEELGVIFMAIGYTVGVILFLICLCLNLSAYYDQIDNIESLQQIDQEIVILEKRSETLLPEFRRYLVELYPEYEKNVYDKISPENISIYLVKYPELKTIEGVKLLVEKINQIKDSIYQKEIEKTKVEKDIRVRGRNKLILTGILPKE